MYKAIFYLFFKTIGQGSIQGIENMNQYFVLSGSMFNPKFTSTEHWKTGLYKQVRDFRLHTIS